MQLRVKTNRHEAAYAGVVVAMSIVVPAGLVHHFMPPFLPVIVQAPFYITAVLIPLLIAVPLAVFGLCTLKALNHTVETLDNFIKFDPLTGLLARNYFLSAAEGARKGGGYILMIDADHFKRINDTHGHDGGDEALKAIARATMQAAGTGYAGRLGGEEFAIYLPGVTLEQAKLVASTLGTLVRSLQLTLSGRAVPLSVSIGIAPDNAASTLTHAMKAADQSLYAAKAAGRDRYIIAGMENIVDIAAA